MKALILASILAVSPLHAAHDMADMKGDLAQRVKNYLLIVNRDSSDINFMELDTKKFHKVPLDKFAGPHMAMITPDGRSAVVTGLKNSTIYVIDMEKMAVRARIPAHGEPEHLNITPDSRYAFVGNMETGIVSVVDIAAGVEAKALEGFSEPHNFEILPDGSKVYVANVTAHEVDVIDVARLEVLKRISTGPISEPSSLNTDKYLGEINGVVCPTLSLDGKFAYAADGDLGVVTIIDTRTDKVVKNVAIGGKPWRAYASPDRRYMLVPINDANELAVIDIKTQSLVAKMPGGADITGVNFVNGGKKAYEISSTEGTVYVFDLEAMVPAGKILIGQNNLLATATTDIETRRIYLCGTTDDTIYVIDGKDDSVTKIPNVGDFPWGTHIMGSNDNYCH